MQFKKAPCALRGIFFGHGALPIYSWRCANGQSQCMPMLYRVLKVLLFAAALTAAMQAIRLLLIEPEDMAQACVLNAAQWQCRVRDLAIQGFARHLYGPISMAAALLGWLGGIRVFAVLAMVAGMAGAVLYDFDVAGLGLLLGTLLLVHSPGPDDLPVVKQQTQAQ